MATPIFDSIAVNPQALAGQVARLRLLNDQVLVKPIRQAERFEERPEGSLLFRPSNPQRNKKTEFSWLGLVIKVGPGDKYKYGPPLPNGSRRVIPHPTGGRYEMSVAPGDTVLYERRPWAEIQLDGEDYVVLIEDQHIIATTN